MKFGELSMSFLFSLLLCSCIHNSNNNSALKISLEDSFTNSTTKLDSQAISEYKILQAKTKDSLLKEKALIWVQYVEKIQAVTNEMRNNIDSSFKSISKSNLEEVKTSLRKKLENYITVIFQINPEIWMTYRKEFPQIIDTNYFIEFNSVDQTSFFKAKTHNSISTIENKAVLLCTKKVEL